MKKAFRLFCAGGIFLAVVVLPGIASNLMGKERVGNISWLYQLQGLNIPSVARSGFPLVVMDYSINGLGVKPFSRKAIQQLIDTHIVPLVYLSIGEAENYRFYWNKNWVDPKNPNQLTSEAPGWLGHTNPDWEGNYKVRYWDPDWRDHYLKPYLDTILEQGFMGVYLDIVDAFEYWADPGIYREKTEIRSEKDPAGKEGEAARRMIALVKWIARYCRTHSSYGKDFLVFPQNGERILLYDRDSSYLDTVSGIGVESTWYGKTVRLSSNVVNERLRLLNKFTRKGKQVLSVDYVDSGNHKSKSNLRRIRKYISKCQTRGFRCYAARVDAELKDINAIRGIQPLDP
ncbi:MAG: MJ1477/TM1410 family putative glycoside hydrolase [Nitrospinaceae bacterium]